MLRYVKVLLMMAALLLLPATSNANEWHRDCRDYGASMTVRCIAVKQEPPGGTPKALSVWECESGFLYESPHSDSYHGPFQYAYGTYEGQWELMPRIVEWFELSRSVHDPRSNIIMAVSWAARYGWGPWSGYCA